jgi:hypothetical protein
MTFATAEGDAAEDPVAAGAVAVGAAEHAASASTATATKTRMRRADASGAPRGGILLSARRRGHRLDRALHSEPEQ